jgi:glycosyltransferase involved in cell wall biosynthesis
MQAVMITMEGREDSALKTAEGLSEAGVCPEIFVQPQDWPIGGEGNNKNSKRAINWAIRHARGPGILFVEDDIIIKPDRFKRAITASQELSELVYFYMHDVQPRVQNYPKEPWIERMIGPKTRRGIPYAADMSGVVATEGPRLMPPEMRMFGAQCVYIPKPYLRFLYAHMDMGYAYTDKIKSSPAMAIDTSLNNWRISNNLPAYCYLPHPVQHLQNRTKRVGTRQDVYSKSFDLVSDMEVDDGL